MERKGKLKDSKADNQRIQYVVAAFGAILALALLLFVGPVAAGMAVLLTIAWASLRLTRQP